MISGNILKWRKRVTKHHGEVYDCTDVLKLTPDEIKLILAARRKFNSQKVRRK